MRSDGYLYSFFKREARNPDPRTGGAIDVMGATVSWSDWKIFSKHSLYLLLSGYFGVADQQVNTIRECSNSRLGLCLLTTL